MCVVIKKAHYFIYKKNKGKQMLISESESVLQLILKGVLFTCLLQHSHSFGFSSYNGNAIFYASPCRQAFSISGGF
jgi:hypothetical protein